MANQIIKVLKYTISILCYYCGFIYLFKKGKKLLGLNQIKIMAYHNISDVFPNYLNLSQSPALFEAQIKYLQEKYEIISLYQALSLIENRTKLDSDKFVITLDDNYKEYYTEVLPIKKRYNVDMTLFVSIDPLSGNEPLFVESVIYSIEDTKSNKLDMRKYDLDLYSLNNQEEKQKAIYEINEYSKILPRKERKDLLYDIYKQLNIDKNTLRNTTLTWNELIEMKNNGINIGSHTISHPFLTLMPYEEAEYEIKESKIILEKKLNTNIDFFAYPFGNKSSYNEKVIDIVNDAGYLGACVLNQQETLKNPFCLKRININSTTCSLWGNKFNKYVFEMNISGFFDLLFFRFLRNHGKDMPIICDNSLSRNVSFRRTYFDEDDNSMTVY